MDNLTAITINTAMIKSSHLQEQLALKLIESASLKSGGSTTPSAQASPASSPPATSSVNEDHIIDIRV